MTKPKAIGLFILMISYISCSNPDDLIGKWDDNIKLSQKEVQFSTDNNFAVISTEGKGWWIVGISMN